MINTMIHHLRSAILIVVFIPSITAQAPPPDPPKGYLNHTLLKIAYALKTLKLVDTKPAIPDHMIAHQGIVYKQTDARDLKIDIYHKKSLKEEAPLLLFIHGGSWKSGDRDDYRRYLIDYAEKGYITASVAYRFSQEAIFPAQLNDIVCAIQWLKTHCHDYRINPEKIALIGGSAGGHLAMMAAYMGGESRYPGSCDYPVDASVQAIVNLYGPADLTTEIAIHTPSVIRLTGRPYSDSTKMLFEDISPIRYISADDPPTLIFHGTIDKIVKVSQSDSLVQVLNRVGVPHEYHRLKGWPHTMDLSLKVNQYCQYYMDRFFTTYLN